MINACGDMARKVSGVVGGQRTNSLTTVIFAY